MIIACPYCTTRYTVDDAAFRPPGRTVRCTTCDHTWFQAPPKAEPNPVTAVLADGPAEAADFGLGDDQIETETARMIAAARASAARFRAGVVQRRGELREWALLIAGIALFVVGGLAMRETVVRVLPGTAAVYSQLGVAVNVRGLDIRDVSYQRQFENGVMVLAIKGKVVNIREHAQEVPKLRFGVRDSLRQELYHWYMKVSRAPLPPGETVSFVARLASPPADAYSVVVRFGTDEELGSPFRP